MVEFSYGPATGSRAYVGGASAAGSFPSQEAFSRQVRFFHRGNGRMSHLLPALRDAKAGDAWRQHHKEVREGVSRRRKKQVR